ncbi:substrate-binding domain-containing protein [bacterium]|nr:substrate-binding domain-containing protein [bacterium]
MNAEIIYELKREKYPFVLIDRYYIDLETDYVITDNKRGGYTAAEYLIKLGHKRIGTIHGIECTAVKDRFEGYREALRDYKILLDLSLVKKVPQNNEFLKEEPSNGGLKLLLHTISKNQGKRTNELARLLKISERTIEKQLKKLKQQEKILFRGSKKTGGYFVKS